MESICIGKWDEKLDNTHRSESMCLAKWKCVYVNGKRFVSVIGINEIGSVTNLRILKK